MASRVPYTEEIFIEAPPVHPSVLYTDFLERLRGSRYRHSCQAGLTLEGYVSATVRISRGSWSEAPGLGGANEHLVDTVYHSVDCVDWRFYRFPRGWWVDSSSTGIRSDFADLALCHGEKCCLKGP